MKRLALPLCKAVGRMRIRRIRRNCRTSGGVDDGDLGLIIARSLNGLSYRAIAIRRAFINNNRRNRLLTSSRERSYRARTKSRDIA